MEIKAGRVTEIRHWKPWRPVQSCHSVRSSVGGQAAGRFTCGALPLSPSPCPQLPLETFGGWPRDVHSSREALFTLFKMPFVTKCCFKSHTRWDEMSREGLELQEEVFNLQVVVDTNLVD